MSNWFGSDEANEDAIASVEEGDHYPDEDGDADVRAPAGGDGDPEPEDE